MSISRSSALLLMPALAAAPLALQAAPKKGVSLDDLKPKKPASTPSRPAPRQPAPKPAPRPAAGKPVPTPVAAKPPAAPPTFTVGEGARFKTLGEALLAAPGGARLLVRSGTYRESLTLARPVEILPAALEDVVTIESNAQSCVSMKTARATLRRLTLRIGAGAGQAAYAVEIPQGQLLLDDCSISSGARACVGVTAENAHPTLRQCRLTGSKSGISVSGRGQATLEGCSLSGNGDTGAAISGGGKATLRGCRIAENGVGLLFQEGSQGRVDDCDVTANRGHGVVLRTGANPTLENVRVFKNAAAGVEVKEDGQGLLVGCELFENGAAGLRIVGAAPASRGCKFRGNKTRGIECDTKGSGTIEDAEVTGNATVGVLVASQSELTVRRTRIIGKSEDAVHVTLKSRATFEGCEISKDAKGAGASVAVHGSSTAVFRKCKVTTGFWGVLGTVGTNLTLDDCDVYETEGPAVRLDGTQAASIVRSRLGRSPTALEVVNSGEALVEDTTLSTAAIGVRIDTGANPTLRRCIVRDCTRHGVMADVNARGLVDRCEISGCGWCGVGVYSGSQTVIRGCKISGTRGDKGEYGVGVEVSYSGLGTIEDCEIMDNRHHGVYVLGDGAPTVRRCKVTGNGGGGLVLGDKGKGTITECDVYRNRGGSVVRTGTVSTVLRDCRTD